MVVKIKKILIILSILLLNTLNIFATDITIIENDYGTKNYLLGAYLLFLLIFWFVIFKKTNPIMLNENKIIASLFNSMIRILCFVWFFVIFWVSRAVLFVSTNADFIDDKLLIINIMFYFTLVVVGLYVLISVIQMYGRVSGVGQFVKKMIYEVKHSNE